MTVTIEKLLGRGFAFPPRIDGTGRMATSSGASNVRESIRIILLTERRERLMLSEFGGGLRRMLFQPNTTTTHRLIEKRITEALGRWERRIGVESVEVAADEADPEAAVATIHYRLVTSNTTDALTVRIPLA